MKFFNLYFARLTIFVFLYSSVHIASPEKLGCALSQVGQDTVVHATSKPLVPFTGIQALRKEALPAVERAYARLEAEIASGERMRSKQTLEDRFLDLVAEEHGGLFHFFDTPEGFELKEIDLPKRYADLLVTDHHDGPITQYFDSLNPKKNTTMQLLERLEKELNLAGGDTKLAAKNLKRRLGNPTTDNLADGMESVYIVNNLERFLEDPSLRDKMKVAQYFVDFGVFGGKSFENDPVPTLKKLYPGKTFAEQDIIDGIKLGKAILEGYNQIILDPQNEVKMGDRFHEVTFGQVREEAKQKALAALALKELDGILNPKSDAEANKLAKTFQEKREAATNSVALQAGKLKADMDKALDAKENAELLADYDANGGKLGNLMFAHYGINPAETGLFAAWAGPGNAHSLPFDLTINPNIGPNKNRTGFILSNIDGREIPSINLKPFGSRIYGLNVLAVRKRLSATGLSGDALDAEVTKQTSTAIGGREPLQYSFGGVELPPEVILAEAYKYLKSQ